MFGLLRQKSLIRIRKQQKKCLDSFKRVEFQVFQFYLLSHIEETTRQKDYATTFPVWFLYLEYINKTNFRVMFFV